MRFRTQTADISAPLPKCRRSLVSVSDLYLLFSADLQTGCVEYALQTPWGVKETQTDTHRHDPSRPLPMLLDRNDRIPGYYLFPRMDCTSSLAAASRSIALGALGAHERNSLRSIHGLDDEACARATVAGAGGRFVPENITHWLQKLKPMTKDISVPRHSSSCCDGYRQFNLQFHGLSDFKFDR